jgi:hypothetical protein
MDGRTWWLRIGGHSQQLKGLQAGQNAGSAAVVFQFPAFKQCTA